MPNEKDLEVMEGTMATLKSFGVPYEVAIISAHRSPEKMFEYICACTECKMPRI